MSWKTSKSSRSNRRVVPLSKAETLDDLRIPEEGDINTLIGKLVAHYLSDDSPEVIDDHKETYNTAIDHVQDLIHRRKQRIAENDAMPNERKVVRMKELDAILGDVSQKGEASEN